MSAIRDFLTSAAFRDHLARGVNGAAGASTPAAHAASAKPAPGLAGGAPPVNPQAPVDRSAPNQGELTKRLAALVGPYKEAVSKNAPEAAQMQPLMAAVKQRIVERNFLAAGKALDELAVLVAQYQSSAPNQGPTAKALVVEAPKPGSTGIVGASTITFTPSALLPDVSIGSVTANFGNGRAASVEIAAGVSGKLILTMGIDGFEANSLVPESFKQNFMVIWDISADDTGALNIDTPQVDISAPTTGTWYRLDSVNPANGKSFVQVSPIVVGPSASYSLDPLGIGIGQQSQSPKIQNTFRIDIKVKAREPKGDVSIGEEVTQIGKFEYTVGPFKSGNSTALESGSIKNQLHDLLYNELPEETRAEIVNGKPAGGEKIEVHGYASNKDSAERNFKLSKERAKTVLDEFQSLGLSASLFTSPLPHGEWESNPTDDKNEEIDDPNWRKVVIKIQHAMTFQKDPKTGEMNRTK
jgi:flagellar motor protein MotB